MFRELCAASNYTSMLILMLIIQMLNILFIFMRTSMLDKSLKSDRQGSDLVREESLSLFKDKEWASFLFFLALSSVTNRRLLCFYLKFGTARLLSFFNNQLVLPRSFYTPSPSSFPIHFCHLLFVSLSSKGSLFEAYPFIPLNIKTNNKSPSSLLANSKIFPLLPKKEKISLQQNNV